MTLASQGVERHRRATSHSLLVAAWDDRCVPPVLLSHSQLRRIVPAVHTAFSGDLTSVSTWFPVGPRFFLLGNVWCEGGTPKTRNKRQPSLVLQGAPAGLELFAWRGGKERLLIMEGCGRGQHLTNPHLWGGGGTGI